MDAKSNGFQRDRSRSPIGRVREPIWKKFDSKPAVRELTAQEIDDYNRDGFCNVRSMFDANEVRMLLSTLEQDAPVVDKYVMHMKDAGGGTSKCVLWNDAGDDLYGMFARGRRWVHAAAQLIGEEPYHFHTKLMIKEPFVGGKWAWHQDFGYWYQTGCLNPDRMFSSILAIDKCTKANGCLQVLKGSHKLGRLEHGTDGEQAGANLDRVDEAMKRFEHVHCEMEPGDVLFTHSNLLHASAPNNSPDWRRVMIVAYNGKDNSPWEDERNLICPLYQQIDVVDDVAIQRKADERLTNASKPLGLLNVEKGTTLTSRQAGFLDHGQNVKQFESGAK